MKYIKLCYLLLLTITLIGCTYSVFSNQLPHLKNVYIEPIINKTEEVDIETEMFNAISDKYIEDGRLSIVSQQPDCIIVCEILSYQDKIYTYDESNNVKEYQVKMVFSVSFTDIDNELVIFENKSLIKTEKYPADVSDPDYTDSDILSEEDARNEIYQEVFNTIMTNTLEAW